MSVLTGFYSLLAGEATITALVPANRITPVLLPEGSPLPAVTYQVVGGSSKTTFDTSGMQKLRVQIDCHGKDYAQADGVREAIRRFLNGRAGALSDGTQLQNAEFIQPLDFFDYEPRQYRCSMEFYLYFCFLA